MKSRPRFEILIDGKWQGGSFATEAEAKAAAAKLKGSAVVRAKGIQAPSAPAKK